MSKVEDLPIEITEEKPKRKLFEKFTPQEIFQMSLISIGGMLIFVLVTGIYVFFFSDFTLTMRILALINSLFGVLFLFSMFVSTWQSYQMVKLGNETNVLNNLMDTLKDVQEIYSKDSINPDEAEKDNKTERGLDK